VTLEERLQVVHERIAGACLRCDRDPSEITLVAVAKTFPVDRVLAAIEAGATDIGENRAQELKEKAAVIGDRARWHFIGPLQTNKVRQVVGTAALIHSVDRFGLGEAIARRARTLGIVQDVLVEVNIAGETSKAGAEPPSAVSLSTELDGLEGLRVLGLMAIPPQTEDPEGARPYFQQLADLGRRLRAELPHAGHLSMGMTRDLEIAVEEGATLVRVGRAIFGPRSR
jgi:pyridoxal phosphate enzyme (YggS family)